MNKYGLIVPTLGKRLELLDQCIESIMQYPNVSIYVVAPVGQLDLLKTRYANIDGWFEDPGKGLAGAINFAEQSLGSEIEIFNWLGDDDRLIFFDEGKYDSLFSKENLVCVFGKVKYVDIHGVEILQTKYGRIAVKTLNFGPNRIPQPGAWIRRSAYEEIGRLDETLGWAFDLDMFIKLTRVGKVRYLPKLVADFRWHDGSLSAGQSNESIEEASSVRIRNLPKNLRKIASFWERPHVKIAKFLAKS